MLCIPILGSRHNFLNSRPFAPEITCAVVTGSPEYVPKSLRYLYCKLYFCHHSITNFLYRDVWKHVCENYHQDGEYQENESNDGDEAGNGTYQRLLRVLIDVS